MLDRKALLPWSLYLLKSRSHRKPISWKEPCQTSGVRKTCPGMHPSTQIVQQALDQRGVRCHVVEMSETTRSAKEAARAIGCTVAEIDKSLVFRAKDCGVAVLAIASGTNRVNEELFASYLGEGIQRADPDFVRAETGFVIGGVPPVGHPKPIRTFLDKDLFIFESIWAAAGTPYAVFQLTPSDLKTMTNGEVVGDT